MDGSNNNNNIFCVPQDERVVQPPGGGGDGGGGKGRGAADRGTNRDGPTDPGVYVYMIRCVTLFTYLYN